MTPHGERGLFESWWRSLDRALLVPVVLLMVAGLIIVFAASPAVAARQLGNQWHFVVRHLLFLGPACLLLFGCSLLKPLGVLRLGKGLLLVGIVLMVAAVTIGPEHNGARRWISAAGIQIQPSEFVKPALAIACAWVLGNTTRLRGMPVALAMVAVVLALLVLQPDLGMALVVASVAGIQLFVAGLPWVLVLALILAGAAGAYGAYLIFPHVADRVHIFFSPPAEFDQVAKALSAVQSGGLFGRGPGEGSVKFTLPDAHTDFVFAATAEEFGIIACLILVGLFSYMLLRALWRALDTVDRFVQLAAVGLACQIGLQALVNMAVNLNLIPTKGMTLPFISYGGSSLLALAIGTGCLLALTRRGARLEDAS